MNNRRNLLIAFSAALFTPGAAFAQAKKPPVVIGWLSGGRGTSAAPGHVAFKEGLAALGWKEAQQYVIEARWAEGRFEQLQPLAEELMAKRPTLIVTTSSRATLVAATSSRNVPIVQANGGEAERPTGGTTDDIRVGRQYENR